MQKLLGTIALSLLAPAVVGQCVNATGASFGGGDDFVANAGNGIDMGFAFPIAGASYQFIHPSSNGFCWLSDGSAAITNNDLSPSEADFYTDSARIAVLWDDLNLAAANGGELFVDTSVANQCTVTWANAVPFGQTQVFNMQVTLFSSGQVDYSWDANANQVTDSIVGISPGLSTGTQSTSIDISAQVPTTEDMTFELFAANAFDLAGMTYSLFPTSPGYIPVDVTVAGACASVLEYGVGCGDTLANAYYELFPIGTQDVGLSGTALSFLRTGTEYTVLDSVPATYVPPTAAAVVVSALDDAFGLVPLSSPMPTAMGTTTGLQVCTNGFIALSDTVPTFTGNSYTPDEAKLLEMNVPVIAGPWYDWSPNVGGQIVYEEVGGIMYVTWDAVQPFNATTTDTFQYQFNIATGDCTIVYDNTSYGGAAAWQTPMFGYTAGSATAAGIVDVSAEVAGGWTLPDVGALPLALSGNAPRLGQNWDLTTDFIDPISPISITFLGDAQFNIPMTAIGFDAPGCDVNINTILGSLTGIASLGSSTVTLPLPATPSLSGVVLTAQSISLTLQNNANLLTSNGVEGTLGS